MESSNLKSPEGEDEQLRLLLQKQAPSLSDDGFTDQVLRAIAPKKPRASHLGLWFSLVGAITGLAFAFEKIGSWSTLSADAGQIGTALLPVLAVLSDPALIVAISAIGTSLLVTFVVSRTSLTHG